MPKLTLYQIDAFASRPFTGNPAAVCLLNKWLPEKLMQDIAVENNLSETAFAVKKKDFYEIRWFTPGGEVDLCGHATLATAYVLFHYAGVKVNPIAFISARSGKLSVAQNADLLTLDFPADPPREVTPPAGLIEAVGLAPIITLKGKTDYLLIYPSQKEITNIAPNFSNLAKVPARGVIISARGDKVDFVSRFFAPQLNVNEDPVTGSAHTTLTPYWAAKLHKTKLSALQLSARGGDLACELVGDRVHISGHAVPYLIGEINV